MCLNNDVHFRITFQNTKKTKISLKIQVIGVSDSEIKWAMADIRFWSYTLSFLEEN